MACRSCMCTLSCTARWPSSSVAAEREAGLHAGAGQPDGEAARVVVAPGAVLLGVGRAAELAPPPHECVVEKPPALEVGEQPGDRTIDSAGVIGVFGQV